MIALLLALFLLGFWSLKVPAIVVLCAGICLIPFVGRIRIGWHDAALFGIALAALPAHLDDSGGLLMLAQVVLFGWALSLAAANATFTPRVATAFVWCALASSCGLAALMLFQVAPGQFSFSPTAILSRDRNEGWYVLGDVAAGAPTIASILGVAIVSCLSLIGAGRRTVPLIALLVSLYGALVLSCGRAAIVASAGILMIYLMSHRGRSVAVRARTWILVAGVPLAGLMPFLRYLKGYQTEGFSRRLESLARLEIDNSVEGRLEFWRYGLDLAASDPRGWGYGYFRELEGYTLHNEYLAQFVGGGWIAGGLFCVLIAGLLFRAARLLWRWDAERFPHRFFAGGVLLLGAGVGMSENFSLSSAGMFYPFMWIAVGLVMNRSFVGEQKARCVAKPERREFSSDTLESIPADQPVARAA